METTEKIVEAYVRYVKGWATIPNIKCPGQYEVDLLAIDPVSFNRYHIETGVSISGAYSKLTAKPFSEKDLKVRVKAAGQRRTVGYFALRKFSEKPVLETLKRYGITGKNYQKIIVTWGWNKEAEKEADNLKIILWDFKNILKEIASNFQHDKTYFTDDTLRTLHLFAKAMI